jgi:hypothetical protein
MTEAEVRSRVVRCKTCRKMFPALKQKPTPSQRAFAIQPPKLEPQPDRGSWWLAPQYADREQFWAAAQTRTFPYSKHLALTPWVVE